MRQFRWHEIRRWWKARAGKNSFPKTPFFFARLNVRFRSCRAKRGNQSGFCSKKVRAAFSNCDPTQYAGVVQWQYACLPSKIREFDSRLPLMQISKAFLSNEIKNSSESWDNVWKHIPSKFPGSSLLESWYRNIVYFPAFNKLLEPVSLPQKDVLELGSGTGNNSLYFSKKYPLRSVTLVDFSDIALQRTKDREFSCGVVKLKKNLLEFRPPSPYGFVHSTGLIEHFSGVEQLAVVRKHAECAEQGGYVMIWVPIRSFAFSCIGKFNQAMGIEEVPLSEQKLKMLCAESNLQIINEGKTAFGALYGILAQKT